MNKQFKWLWLGVWFLTLSCQATRIKDVADVAGVRDNQLIGYGLVVGLAGTGESGNDFVDQSFESMLRNFGIQVPSGSRLRIRNTAAVAVQATLPAFAKPGQRLDITVSAIGQAKSLRGGSLLQTFLKGADGKVYALAQGSLVVGGFGAEGADGSKIIANTPTVGRIPNGAIVEQSIRSPFDQGDFITFNLKQPDFTSAKRLADAINAMVGPRTAEPLDASSVRVYAPRNPGQRVNYLATLENIEFNPASESAKIIVNSRTGTIVIGKDVRLLPAAITHGGLTVKISENPQVSQPNALGQGNTTVTPNSNIQVDKGDGRMFKFDAGASLDDLVQAVNRVGVAPGDLVSILEALKQAGAIQGDLIVI
ncbi:flagellar basal body P-ring protein FlgI [Celerinatantimonas sp. YJH-8]|uniref:flagellar basal body P-ring protein FlgI n=1 Tax=Celerinatantimonas sp. YJH-8 TaxID=3228714 RepID=UPI0038C3BA00